MWFFLLFFATGFLSASAFLPVSSLTDCPNLPPQAGVEMDQVTGSWRLAYLFVDDNDELEEDNTCAVAEIMQVNETQLELLFYVDGRKDELTIDRYTKEFDVTVLSPGEWLLHTPFMHLEFIHVTVIGVAPDHLILLFCVNPFDPDEVAANTDDFNDYDNFLNTVDRDSMDDIFQAKKYNNLFKELDELNLRLAKQKNVRRPPRFLHRKRYARSSEEKSRFESMLKHLKTNKVDSRPRKHLWTAILVKHNNTSALKFVENASLLMKYGYKIAKGQLVSFGSCRLVRK